MSMGTVHARAEAGYDIRNAVRNLRAHVLLHRRPEASLRASLRCGAARTTFEGLCVGGLQAAGEMHLE
ncbi:hypothetical protein N7457_006158 [Penicillium paradoxum]|uniref:uncharacterized protein n=1 Tax=Penicillium paradoxum TaxID=176176 RepID=UPI0025470B96|nr:uncharacterized protein N7457_006158 [Penicillium paradoxum]KAJ5780998.1 hypothetical protein N7457_006158 [Penicillium paradoxum]